MHIHVYAYILKYTLRILFHWQAQEHNNSGDYKSARQFGLMALGCNISVIVFYVIEVIIIVSVLAAYFVNGFGALSTVRPAH